MYENITKQVPMAHMISQIRLCRLKGRLASSVKMCSSLATVPGRFSDMQESRVCVGRLA